MMTLPGSNQTINRGYYALLRFYPSDVNGHDYASRTLKVTSVEMDGPNGQVIPFAYPFQYGTFSGAAGYQLELNTRNLTSGPWTLVVKIGSGTNGTTGGIAFRVKSGPRSIPSRDNPLSQRIRRGLRMDKE